MKNRKAFYDSIRDSIFGGTLKQEQVEGIGFILDVWYSDPKYAELPTEYLAYILATAEWETAGTMQPIREYGRGRNRRYGRPDPETGHVYYGRGHVQLTWGDNYKKMTEVLKLPPDQDLYLKPDLALNPTLSVRIMVEGMLRGIFTGKKLSDFIKPGVSVDYRNARKIVNGVDQAETIAEMARKFERALKLLTTELPPLPSETPQAPPVPVSWWQQIINTLKRLFGL